MGDIAIVKTAHHMDDGIGGADIAEKLVAQPLSFGGPLYQACNVDKFDDSGGDLFGLMNLCQPVQSLIRYGDSTHIGIDGTKRIVGGFRSGVGDGIEQRALAHIGKPHDT